ncbi:hypothetical protein [Natronococcus jeotgali]|uniref:Uncharacterized protein n=1 Tax=Natronococcus jeotgali DSM 18795 TaxID=1227498 RepID=L9X9X2_9EURY|nr:hypothetical protein [Natronococcus jeotgali]ELY58539.1 hypothetical protein C492_12010 [Natronococcus jeotgali DSM 18795]
MATNSETASRRAKLGLAGLASLCCLGPGATAVSGGALAYGLAAGGAQLLVTALALGGIGLVVRRRNCSTCSD